MKSDDALSTDEGLPTYTFDDIFRQHEFDAGQSYEVVPVPGYGQKEVIQATILMSMERITEENTGRQRVEITQPYLSVLVTRIRTGTFANSSGVITKYGDHVPGWKHPEGHTFVRQETGKPIRWEDQDIKAEIEALVGQDVWEEDWLEINNEGKSNQQAIKHYVTKTEAGVYATKSEIVSGPGHGREWARVYKPRRIEFTEQSGGFTVEFGIGLGYGLILEQGDISDKIRTQAGTTHFADHLRGFEVLDLATFGYSYKL